MVPDHVGLVGQRRGFGFHSRGDRDGQGGRVLGREETRSDFGPKRITWL